LRLRVGLLGLRCTLRVGEEAVRAAKGAIRRNPPAVTRSTVRRILRQRLTLHPYCATPVQIGRQGCALALPPLVPREVGESTFPKRLRLDRRGAVLPGRDGAEEELPSLGREEHIFPPSLTVRWEGNPRLLLLIFFEKHGPEGWQPGRRTEDLGLQKFSYV